MVQSALGPFGCWVPDLEGKRNTAYRQLGFGEGAELRLMLDDLDVNVKKLVLGGATKFVSKQFPMSLTHEVIGLLRW